MAEELDEPIKELEIRQIISTLKNNKSPGPDGYINEFYKVFTDMLSPLLLHAYHHALQSGTMAPTILVIHKDGLRDYAFAFCQRQICEKLRLQIRREQRIRQSSEIRGFFLFGCLHSYGGAVFYLYIYAGFLEYVQCFGQVVGSAVLYGDVAACNRRRYDKCACLNAVWDDGMLRAVQGCDGSKRTNALMKHQSLNFHIFCLLLLFVFLLKKCVYTWCIYVHFNMYGDTHHVQ